jgi:hypothetical protein
MGHFWMDAKERRMSQTNSPTIENLMKVCLEIRTGGSAENNTAAIPFEFIFGVGPSGITAFEKALFGKRVGDRVRFEIAPTAYRQSIGHLQLPRLRQGGIMAPLAMELTITGVVRASDRDIVKAIAAGGGCGDCGCGCGGH